MYGLGRVRRIFSGRAIVFPLVLLGAISLTYSTQVDFGETVVRPPGFLEFLSDEPRPRDNVTIPYDPGKPDAVQLRALERAEQLWEEYNPGLNLTRSAGAPLAISWIDGADAPCSGSCVVPAGSAGCGTPDYVVGNNAVHALGHVLGVGHSQIQHSVMVGDDRFEPHPSYQVPRRFLDSDHYKTGWTLEMASINGQLVMLHMLNVSAYFKGNASDPFMAEVDGLESRLAEIREKWGGDPAC